MFEVSVPGSVMLMGEHAVLHGYPSIVAAINRRITATLMPRADKVIHIDADDFGETKLVMDPVVKLRDDGEKNKKFRYVIVAIQQFQNNIPSGFDLRIKTNFSDKLGLGSSAAVTVATLAVLQKWISQKIDLAKIHELGVKVVHAVQQGLGSGADIAASVYGGVVLYRIQPVQIEKIDAIPKITLIYTGYKTPTVEVIKRVNASAENAPDYFENLYRLVGDLVLEGVECFKQQDWRKLGELFLRHFDVQRALGVSDAEIEKIIAKLNKMPQIYGAKISGSGLGDCVVALGKASDDEMQLIDVKIDERGIICSQ